MKRINRIKKRHRSLIKAQQQTTVINLKWKYHIISANDTLLLSTNKFHEAWLRIRGEAHGSRLVRNDGELLAYASVQGGRIKKGFPVKVSFIGTLIQKAAMKVKEATKKVTRKKTATKKAAKTIKKKKGPPKRAPKKSPKAAKKK